MFVPFSQLLTLFCVTLRVRQVTL